MKFIYADAMDFVDPGFDFKNERNAERRIVQWDDEYPHEFLDRAPYDGILVSRGVLHQETALRLEMSALEAVRQHVAGNLAIDVALDRVLEYWKALNWREDDDQASQLRALIKQREIYRRTLNDKPWQDCLCRVCREGGVEALLFRNSNRNKRRGMHNLHVFYQHLLAHRHAA
jgi:hypothetical protein